MLCDYIDNNNVFEKLKKLKQLRQNQSNLPVFKFQESIIKTVAENQITIIAGDTGCGKVSWIGFRLVAYLLMGNLDNYKFEEYSNTEISTRGRLRQNRLHSATSHSLHVTGQTGWLRDVERVQEWSCLSSDYQTTLHGLLYTD